MIVDTEMRALFKAESEEYLRNIEQGILALEQNPGNRAAVQGLFRDAHSLKGSARMLALSEVEHLAHAFEELLRGVEADDSPMLSRELSEQFFAIADALRRLVDEAVTGTPCDVDWTALLPSSGQGGTIAAREAAAAEEDAELIPLPPAGDDTVSQDRVLPDDRESKGGPRLCGAIMPDAPREEVEGARAGGGPLPSGEYRIETIRVRTKELDGLITLVGELMVASGRIATRLEYVDELEACWEEGCRPSLGPARTGEGGQGLCSSGSEGEAANGGGGVAIGRMTDLLVRLRAAVNEDNARLSSLAKEIENRVRTIRLLPLSTVFDLFPRMVRDLAMQEGKEVQLVVEGRDTPADKRIIEEIKDPLIHMIRNAIDHGIEVPEERRRLGKPANGTVSLRAWQTADHIVVEVEDDGRGVDPEKIRSSALQRRLYPAEELAAMSSAQLSSLLFLPGLSTSSFVTDVSGRGVGLDVVRSRVEGLKGSVVLEATPGQGCQVRLRLPLTLATTRVVVAKVNGWPYAIPAESIRRMIQVRPEEIFAVKGRAAILLDGEPVPVARLADILQLPAEGSGRRESGEVASPVTLMVLSAGGQSLAVGVDEMLDEQEVVVKPAGALLKRVRHVAGATILNTGTVCFIVNPLDMLLTAQRSTFLSPEADGASESVTAAAPALILYAEDSLTTRTQIKRILESDGFEVETAVDGLAALEKLHSRPFSALVSDIMMPNMDGFELTTRIRADKHYHELPIILVTTLDKEADRRRGLEVGANAYITKGAFDQTVLLDTLRRLL